jgi:hypothetical protein
MLYGERVAVCCENRTEHTDTLCGYSAELLCLEASGVYTSVT